MRSKSAIPGRLLPSCVMLRAGRLGARSSSSWGQERAIRAEAELKAEAEAAENGRHHKGEVEMQRKELARQSIQARHRNEVRVSKVRESLSGAGVGRGAAGARGHGDEDEEGEERRL